MSLGPEIKTILIAMSPIVELRGSIPIAIEVYNLSALSALALSILGDLVPTVFILLLLEPIYKYLSSRFLFFEKFFNWLFQRTRKKHKEKFEKWKKFALTLIVAIPLPFTGAWTGAICAFLFGIPFRQAVPLIFLGVMIAGIIVTLATLGVFGFIRIVIIG